MPKLWDKKGCISNREFLSLHFYTGDANVEKIEILVHKNKKKTAVLCRPFIWTKLFILKREHDILSSSKPPKEIYSITLEESGGLLKSKAPSKKPRNLKQVYNCLGNDQHRRSPLTLTFSRLCWWCKEIHSPW